MNLLYKICLVNVGLIFIFSIVASVLNRSVTEVFLIAFGLGSLGYGLICGITGLILYGFKKREWAKGFLLSSGVLLLLSATTCSSLQ